MRITKQCLFILATVLVSVGAKPGEQPGSPTGSIIARISGFRGTGGVARAALFEHEHGFPDDPERAAWKGISEIRGSEVIVQIIGIPYGTYALGVYHDVNNNAKLDKRWGFIPQEGFGTSNNTRDQDRAPSFQDAAFTVNTDTTSVHISLEYLLER